jgi:hypothetical protein
MAGRRAWPRAFDQGITAMKIRPFDEYCPRGLDISAELTVAEPFRQVRRAVAPDDPTASPRPVELPRRSRSLAFEVEGLALLIEDPPVPTTSVSPLASPVDGSHHGERDPAATGVPGVCEARAPA